MNKIYKVIWSKVKNQYVVVSELAHSNGKQSRTSRNSIRSRIAALVVCGAIAAFGVFSALPNSAYAADSDYIAFVTTENGQNANENKGDTILIKGYKYTSTRIAKPDNSYTWYWVRDGYNIQLERLERPGSDGSKDYVVRAFKDGGGEVETSLVHSYQNKIEDTGVTTLNGKYLHSYEAGVYAGGSNGYTAVRMENKWSEADQTFKPNNDPMIFDGKKWRQAERTDFKEVKFNEETGNYEYNGQIVATENLYVVDFVKTKGNDTDLEKTRLGCFVVDGKVYTGTVHGKNNEILMTGINEDNKYVTYWASEYTDEKATMAQMPISQYNETISGLASDINAIHQDDIKKIQINQIDNGGSINLQTNGEFVPARDENGDIITDETGKPVYVAQGGKNIPGGITIRNTTNSGSEGNDVAVEISNGKNSFTVDAGSKVVGKVTEDGREQDAGVSDANKTLTGLKINGVEYDLSQGKTYSPGQGIAINDDDNKISVNAGNGLEFTSESDDAELKVKANKNKGITVDSDGVAVNAGEGLTFGTDQTDKGQLKVNVGEGLSINGSNQIVNNLKVTEATKNENDPNEDHSDGGNWKIEDSAQSGKVFKNTILSSSVTSKPESEVNNGETEESGKRVVYGKDYTISDTDGNTATLSDVASAKTLQNVDKRLITTEGNVETINNTLTGAVMYDKDDKDENGYNKESVTLGGEKTYETEGTGVKLTNVAYANTNTDLETYDGSAAVNVDLLKDYVDENGGGSWKLTTSQDDNETTVGKGNTVDLAGATKGEEEHQNIKVTQTPEEIDGKLTGNTEVKFDLNNKLVLGENNQITIDGSKGSATIGGVNITTTTTDGNTSSTIDGLTNTDWDESNTTYDGSAKAATEGQLYDALTGLSKEADVAVVHANNSGNKDATGNNLKDTKAVIWNEAGNDERSSSIALGKDAFVSVQNGYKSQGILFGSDTYTGGIAIGQEATALNGTVNIGVKDYKGQMGDVTISSNRNPDKGSNKAYNTYPASGTGETSIGSNSYISGMLSTNTGSYNIVSTKYMNDDTGEPINVNGQLSETITNYIVDYVKDNAKGPLANMAIKTLENNKASIEGLINEKITGAIGDKTAVDVNNLYALQNTGSVVMGTLNSIESNTSEDSSTELSNSIMNSMLADGNIKDKIKESINDHIISGALGLVGIKADDLVNGMGSTAPISAKLSGVANNVIGMANKTNNTNGSLVFGTGNEITNSLDDIPLPDSVVDSIKQEVLGKFGGKITEENAADVAKAFREAVADRQNKNGGAVLAIGGGNKADYALNSQLIGVQNQIKGTKEAASQYNMVNGYQNTVENGSNDTVIGVKNTVTNGDSNIVLGDNHTVQNANNNVILGSSDKETTHTVSDTVVIGHNAQANSNNDVAIGSGSVANGAVGTAGYAGANPIGTVSVGNEKEKRTITNVAAGRISDTSTDAVNGSQLYATNQKVDAGWKATVGETSIDVKPTKDEDGNNVVPTLNFAGDRNIDVTADKASSTINVSLKDNVVLGGKESNDPRVQIGGTNGTIMATKNPNSIAATTTIDGGNIYVGSSVSVGANDDVVITDKNITGLSNTTWDEDVKNAVSDSVKGEDKTEATKAATQAQLLEATDNISSDVDSLNDFAVKYDKNPNSQ